MSRPKSKCDHFVYLATNTKNEKVYVGKTSKSLRHRWVEHVYEARTRRHQFFHKAINKHGAEAFELQILAHVGSEQVAFDLERLWIVLLRSAERSFGYNLSYGGEGPRHTEETKRRIGEKAKARGVWWTVPLRLGKTHSLETRKLISQKSKGKPGPPHVYIKGTENFRFKKHISPEHVRAMKDAGMTVASISRHFDVNRSVVDLRLKMSASNA